MKKIYMFLLNTNDKTEYEAATGSKVYGKYVYAITDEKQKAKDFMATRDMTKFKLEIFHVDSDEAYNHFMRQKGMIDAELVISSFPTSTEYNGYLTIDYVKVLCTVRESDIVEYDYDSYILDKMENIIASIDNMMREKFDILNHGFEVADSLLYFESMFNKKIRDALEELDFKDYLEEAAYQIDNTDSSEYNLNEDKLKVYCMKFSNTYKEGLKL